MNHTELSAYADIVISAGVNLRKGQNLLIGTGPGTYEFARILADAAYRAGANYVEIGVADNYLLKSRIEHSAESSLSFVPNYDIVRSNEMLAYDWARVRIDSTEEIDALKNVDSSRLQTIAKAQRSALSRMRQQMMNDQHAWCVIAAPGPKWAAKTLGKPESAETTDEFWKVLQKILRLDQPDPVAAWKQHGHTLKHRCHVLDEIGVRELHITGPGTDLRVGLTDTSKWKGGPAATPAGREFSPNIPTEEVFTTPHYAKTDGTVRVVRPVKVLETLVRGASFEFTDGVVTGFDAEEGRDVLERYLQIDEGSSRLGEIALVDTNSPIYQSGLLFNSILYDENASIHMAIGGGYPSCLSNAKDLVDNESMMAAGCNVSLVHTDFMIGDPDTTVRAIDAAGKEHVIIENGSFVV